MGFFGFSFWTAKKLGKRDGETGVETSGPQRCRPDAPFSLKGKCPSVATAPVQGEESGTTGHFGPGLRNRHRVEAAGVGFGCALATNGASLDWIISRPRKTMDDPR